MIPTSRLSTRGPKLGVLSIHLEPGRCRVGCEFCYLGLRDDERSTGGAPARALIESFTAAIERVEFDELAVAVNEPRDQWLELLGALGRVVRARGRELTLTTTLDVAGAGAEPLLASGATRVNLSLDPSKGSTTAARVADVSRALKAVRSDLDIVVLATLESELFARELVDGGGLRALLDLATIDKVVLNGVKPPPAWCDSRFWMRAAGTLAPLIDRHIDRRLFLDCYVAARIFRLGECPARPDLTPSDGGLAFRSCVYQPSADFVTRDPAELSSRLRGFSAPKSCPFPIV
jgi:hypothetical protein